MTAPRAFLIPSNWGMRPFGRLSLIEDGPFRIAGAASPLTAQRELISGTPFVTSGTVLRERDYIGWGSGYSNMAGFSWPGGTGTIIARAARFVSGQTNYYFGGCLCNDTSVTVSSGNFTMNNSTTGSFGVFGGVICATADYDPRNMPYFVAKSLQSTRADMAAYNHNGKLLKSFSRTGISGQSQNAGQMTSCYFGGPNSSQSRNGTLTEMVVLVGGLTADDMHAVVRQFYGLFFRPIVERTFFIPTPSAGGGVTVTGAVSESVAAVVAPTVVQGSLSITPPTDSAVAAVVAPTVVAGSLNLTPSANEAVAAIVAPSVVLGSISITPAEGAGVVSTVAPTVVEGSISITPPVLAAIAATLAPSVVLGSMSVTPPAVEGVAATSGPTVVVGGILITNPIAFGVVEGIPPNVSLGSVVVTGALADAIIATLDPTVSSGGLTITGAIAAAVSEIVPPNVVLGSLVLIPSSVISVAAAAPPSVVLGHVNITPSAASVVCVSLVGSVSVGDLSLFGGLRGEIDVVYMRGNIRVDFASGTVTAEPALKAKVTLN